MTDSGSPTTPIAFSRPATEVGDRLGGTRVAVDDALLGRLAGTGAEVLVAADATAEASRDWWPLAMIWALDGETPARAAAVVRPHDAAQVAAVLAACDETRTPVTPAAGRSGVCGASIPVHGGVVLDLTAMSGIVDVDHESLVLDVLPGTFGTWLEDTLRTDHGVTVGHWPQSIDLSTVGGWLACRGAGQMSTRYGKIEDMVVGLDVALADGRRITTGGAPRAAVGPDLNQVFVGSEGTLGVITGALAQAPSGASGRATRGVRVPELRGPRTTRAGGSSSAARIPRCCGCTTQPSPTAPTTPVPTTTSCSSSTRATPRSSTPR